MMLREVGAIKVKPGDPMPDIALPSTRGRPMSPAEFSGKKHVILYFYPGNESRPELAGCTKEACAFRDRLQNFRDLDAQVVGVSRQSAGEQQAFIEAHNLNFPILSDAEGKLGAALGVPEIHIGKEVYWKRLTFIADKHGIVQHVFPEVNPERHIEEVLTALLPLQRRR